MKVVHQHYAYHSNQSRKAPVPLQCALQNRKQQVCDQRHPYMYLDGIGAFAVEVSQREILFYLLEKRFNLPSAPINRCDCLQRHVKIVGQERYESGLFALLDVDICDYPCNMVDVVLAEHHNLLTIFHKSPRILMHTVDKHLIIEFFIILVT